MLHLIEKCIGLEHVELDGHSINAASIEVALQQKNLRNLSLNGCPNVSLQLVEKWRNSFPDKSIRYTEWRKKQWDLQDQRKVLPKQKSLRKRKKSKIHNYYPILRTFKH